VTAIATAMASARATATATATTMVTAMAMMTATAKVMASSMVMRTGMGGRWEAAACGRRLLAVGRRGDKEDNDEKATMTNRATETPQLHDNQLACKSQEAPADDGRLKRGGGNERAAG
jgi:hypothetical protein